MPESPQPILFWPGMAIHLFPQPPPTQPQLSPRTAPPPPRTQPIYLRAFIFPSLCEQWPTQWRKTGCEEGGKKKKILSGNMQKCEKVDAGCPGNGSEVISKRWWKSMSCARQAGTSVLRKIRKSGGLMEGRMRRKGWRDKEICRVENTFFCSEGLLRCF